MNKALKLTAVVKAIDPDDPVGSFEAILSAPTLDRDGEVVDSKAFEPLPESIPIHINHDFWDVRSAVARGVPFYDGDLLKVRGVFASDSESQLIRSKVAEGIVTTMSVGFINAQVSEVDGVRHITAGELIEASFVSVPSNREALVSLAKAFDPTGVGDAFAQSLHDFAASHGATCDKAHSTEPPEQAAAPAAASPADPAAASRLAVLAEAELLLID